MTDWTEMRRLYRQGGITYKELARRFDIPLSTVYRHIREENSDRRDLSAAADCLSRAVLSALGDTRQFYVPAKAGEGGEEKLDIKSVKEMTAVLRDLASLRQTLREDSAPAADDAATLRVVLEGEAEQWSR